MSISEVERLRRWRLMLGAGVDSKLNERDKGIDQALTALYGRGGGEGAGMATVGKRGMRMKLGRGGHPGQGDGNGDGENEGQGRHGSLDDSAPTVTRWLGDIRDYFPDSVVQVMQADAIEKIGLGNLLSEPDIIEQIEPDVSLVSSLLALKDAVPTETKASARILVRKVVEDLMKRLENPMREAVRGALNRANRTRNPKLADINWHRTIYANLKHYQEELGTVIPESLIGYGRKRSAMKHEIVICIDQSGSMAQSLVYASVFGAVLASLPAVHTQMVLFDTSVVDITPQLQDPVDVLFGAYLGGGTDIAKALRYCQSIISRPLDTTFILITDLFEGGSRDELLNRAHEIVESGVQFVTLLALSDSGAPGYDHDLAARFASMGIPSFACTPDLFPELMAATINRENMSHWAHKHGLATGG